jgi:hypothetical protein
VACRPRIVLRLGPGERVPRRIQIDRIDGTKEYAPENCRWVSQFDNQNNRRSNRWLTHNGERLTDRAMVTTRRHPTPAGFPKKRPSSDNFRRVMGR